MHKRLEPKLFTVFKEGYTRQQLFHDTVAGVIVGVVALPLAVAFAIASGVKPEQGLFTAIIAGLIVAALGGSRVQISGPTGAFIVVVYSIVQQYGYSGLALATTMAGVLLIIMGFARFGTLLKFIPYPLTVGFTSGIALIIFSSQIKDFFGLNIANVPADFIEKWDILVRHAATINYRTFVVGAVSLLIILLWPKVTHRIPGSLIAIIVVTAAVHLFDIDVETVGSRFGNVPNKLPAPRFPLISWKLITQMFSPALTIALLGAIESLLSAVVADGMLGTRHRSNMELIGQGLANLASPLFAGIPATGAIARTATNIKNGGRTPVAGIIHSITLLLIMVFFAHWAELIPMATLSAILIFVAYNMSEWHSFRKILRSPKSDIAIMLTTFSLTVLIDLTVAIEVGIVLAALFFMNRMASVSQASIITKELQEEEEPSDDPQAISKRTVPEDVEVFEVYGSLFFAAVDQFKEAVRQIEKKPRALILRMRNLYAIDATGLQALEDILQDSLREGTTVLLAGVHAQPLVAMQRSGLLDRIGEKNVCGNIDEAIGRAKEIPRLDTLSKSLSRHPEHHET